jgi:hypothetical protein
MVNSQCRPQNEVHAGTSDGAECRVDPEHDFHHSEQPRTTDIRNTVLAHGDEDDYKPATRLVQEKWIDRPRRSRYELE